jgi:hypothetical protein
MRSLRLRRLLSPKLREEVRVKLRMKLRISPRVNPRVNPRVSRRVKITAAQLPKSKTRAERKEIRNEEIGALKTKVSQQNVLVSTKAVRMGL